MKLRLVLKTNTKSGKEVSIKFNIAPSKQQGILNLIHLAYTKNQEVSMSFEKISKSGEREESKVKGSFKFEIGNFQELEQIIKEVDNTQKRRKKIHHKRLQK